MMADFSSMKLLLLIFLFGSGHNYHLVTAKNDPNCGLRGPETDVPSRIVGGEKALPHEYPWMGYLQLPTDKGDYVCGASLINELWLVTAAHCLEDVSKSPTVILGSNTPLKNHEEPSKVHATVAKWFPHPQYNSIINDIALLKLAKEVDLSGPNISSICVPEKDQSEAFVGRYCTATGWGRTSNNGGRSEDLLKVQLPIISRGQCREMFNSDQIYVPSKAAFCTWSKGKDTCKGDSGGPLNCRDNNRWYLTGITSYGMQCADQYPSVWANTGHYTEWIWKTIADNS